MPPASHRAFSEALVNAGTGGKGGISGAAPSAALGVAATGKISSWVMGLPYIWAKYPLQVGHNGAGSKPKTLHLQLTGV